MIIEKYHHVRLILFTVVMVHPTSKRLLFILPGVFVLQQIETLYPSLLI